MTANRRLHSVLLTLWDIARDNPNYNRKLWGELQFCLTNLETRNNLLCALLSDLLHCIDDAGDIMWEGAAIHSPPSGYSVRFIREELERGRRPKLPKTEPVIPTNVRGEAIDPYDPIESLRGATPPPTTMRSDVKEKSFDDLVVDYGPLNGPPIGGGDEYDVGDESDDEDHLAFEFDLTGFDDAPG